MYHLKRLYLEARQHAFEFRICNALEPKVCVLKDTLSCLPTYCESRRGVVSGSYKGNMLRETLRRSKNWTKLYDFALTLGFAVLNIVAS